jgi:hypothetical protein
MDRLDLDAENAEDRGAGNRRRAFLFVEVNLLALKLVEMGDALGDEDMILGVVELGDVMDAVVDIAIQDRVLALEVLQMLLLGDTHIDAAEKKDIEYVGPAAAPQDRQHAHAVHAVRLVDDRLDVLCDRRVGAGNAGSHNRDGVLVRLVLPVEKQLGRVLG